MKLNMKLDQEMGKVTAYNMDKNKQEIWTKSIKMTGYDLIKKIHIQLAKMVKAWLNWVD